MAQKPYNPTSKVLVECVPNAILKRSGSRPSCC